MEKAVLFSCVLILVIQIARAQNLAALFGLGGFDMAESQTPGSSSCPYQVHPDRRKFNQLVNNRMMTQECAPGTMFVLSKCSCDNIPKGGNGGGPMPGSNPRMEAGLGADRNSMMSALMSQLSGALGGAFPPPTPRAPRPSPRNNSPMNTNQLNSVRQKVTSGIRPDQSNGGTVAKHFQKPPSAPSPNSQFNLDPSTGLTSVVDPSLLPDILNNGIPPAVKKMLDRASKPPTRRPSPTKASRPSPTRRPYPTESPSRRPPTRRPYPTEPPSRRPPTKKQSPPTPSSQVLPPGGLPGDVLKMLQKSMQPPRGASKKVNPGRSKQRKTKRPPTASNIRRKPTPFQATNTRRPTPHNRAAGPRPTRRPTPHNRAAGPRLDPLAGLMAQLTGGMKKGPEPSRRSRTRKDPLAALLGGSSQPSRGPMIGTNRATSSKTNRGSSRPTSRTASRSSGNVSGGNPMAALMAGIGGGPSSSSTGGGADPFAALMAGMGGGAGSPTGGALGGNDLAALMAGLGGGSNPGSASTSLTGNTNVAPLLGGTTAPAKPKIIDMTNFFNAQGIMSGTAGLRAQNNVPINYAKLHQLDLMEVIDLGDLTPAGLLAANAHFSKPGSSNIIG